jgi:DNA replication licensing factor MCM5
MLTPPKNIDFQTTILSRFDMIFIVKDVHDEQRDRVSEMRLILNNLLDCYQTIAKHVMNIHMNRPNPNAAENGEVIGEIDIDKMKRYISYCKSYVTVHLLVRVI